MPSILPFELIVDSLVSLISSYLSFIFFLNLNDIDERLCNNDFSREESNKSLCRWILYNGYTNNIKF